MYAVGQIELQVITHDEKLVVDSPADEGYVLGRSDSSASYVPDIDLMAYEAQHMGVSRRHAALVRYQGVIHIVDLHSANGTFLNSERLAPQIPYPLNNGDSLLLGNLELTIHQPD